MAAALDVPFAGTASASLVGESADPETGSSGEVSDLTRTLTATLHDATSGQPLGSRTIEFFADGLSLGTGRPVRMVAR